jgi:hypothetical protein
MEYPDATVLDGVKRSGVPQFKLITPRTFVTVFDSNGTGVAEMGA